MRGSTNANRQPRKRADRLEFLVATPCLGAQRHAVRGFETLPSPSRRSLSEVRAGGVNCRGCSPRSRRIGARRPPPPRKGKTRRGVPPQAVDPRGRFRSGRRACTSTVGLTVTRESLAPAPLTRRIAEAVGRAGWPSTTRPGFQSSPPPRASGRPGRYVVPPTRSDPARTRISLKGERTQLYACRRGTTESHDLCQVAWRGRGRPSRHVRTPMHARRRAPSPGLVVAGHPARDRLAWRSRKRRAREHGDGEAHCRGTPRTTASNASAEIDLLVRPPAASSPAERMLSPNRSPCADLGEHPARLRRRADLGELTREGAGSSRTRNACHEPDTESPGGTASARSSVWRSCIPAHEPMRGRSLAATTIVVT